MDRCLQTCSAPSVKLWCHLRFVMEHESTRFGYVQHKGIPLSRERIAQLANCSPPEADLLLHDLTGIGLLSFADSDSAWFSPYLARIETLRASSRTRAQRSRIRSGGARAPNVAPDVARVSRADVQQPLLTLLPGEKKEIAAQSISKPGEAGKAAKPQKKRRTGKRDRSPEEHAAWRKFIGIWCNTIWPQYFHGEVYDMNRGASDDPDRPFRLVWQILDYFHMDVDAAVGTARVFAMNSTDWAGNHPNPLKQLRKDLLKWSNHFKLFGEQHGNRNASTDAYAIPILNRRPAAAG
jgi:hypothetical protein